MSKNTIQAPKGIPEYFPPQSANFTTVRDTFVHQARLAGYEHIELPIFEDTSLFARGVGESTDVVSKEMYTFEDKGGRSVTLRPEGTAGVMRTVIQHHLDRGNLPLKFQYTGPFFRYERPQAGRYRQLQQMGIEAIGVDDPALDAEVIALGVASLHAAGIKGFRLELTSLGDNTCRPAYREALQEFLFKLPLDDATRQRAEINPLRVLDDKRPEVKEMTADAPLMLDYLSSECREHFETVTGLLDDMQVAYEINPRLVRGLDYYTKTCFEFVHDGLGAQSGIGGGGRYDGLMSQLGGADLSGIGYALGVDRCMLAREVEQAEAAKHQRVAVFGVPLGSSAKMQLAGLAHQLRAADIATDIAYGDRSLKSAMKQADRSGAKVAIILGESEIEAGEVVLKDLESQQQHNVPASDVVAEIRRLLAQ